MKSKYLIIELSGMESPLVISSFFSHETMAMSVRAKIRSAGLCELDSTGRWTANGQSLSLKLEARPQDAMILNDELGPSFLPIKQARTPSTLDAEINA